MPRQRIAPDDQIAQLEYRKAQRALAAPALAHERDRLVLVQGQVDAVDRMHAGSAGEQAATNGKVNGRLLDRDQLAPLMPAPSQTRAASTSPLDHARSSIDAGCVVRQMSITKRQRG